MPSSLSLPVSFFVTIHNLCSDYTIRKEKWKPLFSARRTFLKIEKESCFAGFPPAAGRASDIFHSAAVRSSRSVFIS